MPDTDEAAKADDGALRGPLLEPGYRNVALFGLVHLVAVIVIARLTTSGFASVRCVLTRQARA